MHSDARSLPDGTKVEAEICIVGAGAAGISIAREFDDTKHDILLVEAGGFDSDPATQALYEGENTGLPYFSLSRTRLRYFGGTTNHWAGYCSTLDSLDFENRDWVPMSGWPLSLGELKPFYRRAHPLCDLGDYNYEADYWKRKSENFSSFLFEGPEVETKIFKWSSPTRFGDKYRSDITQSENIDLWTHANVTRIQTSRADSFITGLKVQCLNGKEHDVKANQYVLACGGLENPRLMLSNNIGNDIVGKYFMEHPHVQSGKLIPSEWPSLAYTNLTPRKAGKAFALPVISTKMQRKFRLLNYSCFLYAENNYSESFPDWLYNIPNVEGIEHYLKDYFESPPLFKIESRIEQRPNPNSRVTLSGETDALGLPKIKLNWALTDQEKRTVRIATETIAEEVGRRGVGRIRLAEWLTDDSRTWPDSLVGGNHHMGTTRMSESPKRGVVNSNCRVHGVQNLFVAGSSVYPTSGTANPTLTLVSLAIRLADHLKSKVSE